VCAGRQSRFAIKDLFIGAQWRRAYTFLARPADVHRWRTCGLFGIQFQHNKNSRRKKKGKPMHFHHEFHRFISYLFPRGVDINSSVEILMWPDWCQRRLLIQSSPYLFPETLSEKVAAALELNLSALYSAAFKAALLVDRRLCQSAN
jgi:hypothetical protein